MRLVGRSGTIAAALAVAALIGMHDAGAATITETAPVAGQSFFDPGKDVFLPAFDLALGTLTSASFSLTGTLTPGVTYSANVVPIPPGTVTFNPTISVSKIGGGSSQLAKVTLLTETIPAVGGSATGTPETINTTVPLSLTDLPVDQTNLGQLDFYILASGNAALPPGGNVPLDKSTINAQLAVTFTYTPTGTAVPEPASLTLFGAGVLGLGIARGFRNGRASLSV